MYCTIIMPPYNIFLICREKLVHKEHEAVLVMMVLQDMVVTKVEEDYVALRYVITMTTFK